MREPVPRYQPWAGPAIFSQGFRPFFLLAGVWGALILPLSVEMMRGHVPLLIGGDPMGWHRHEMLFGYVAAVIAGFLLTAIPNWTGRLPLSGRPLMALVGLWVLGRVAMALAGHIPLLWVAVMDVAFLAALFAVTLREIIRGRNWRNLPVIAILGVVVIGNILVHAEEAGAIQWDGAPYRLVVAAITVLIVLIGGRVVPSFTRNWLMKAGATRLPAGFTRYDRVTVGVTAAALIAWVAGSTGMIATVLLGVAAVLNALRLARWRGWTTGREPLLWVLHVGYLWIPVGLVLLALGAYWPGLSQSAALHALTAGAMGTMTMAMMTRASLGHTGQALHAGWALTTVYVLLIAAGVLRVSAPLWGGAYDLVLTAAMAAWTIGFALFVVLFAPLLARRKTPRAG